MFLITSCDLNIHIDMTGFLGRFRLGTLFWLSTDKAPLPGTRTPRSTRGWSWLLICSFCNKNKPRTFPMTSQVSRFFQESPVYINDGSLMPANRIKYPAIGRSPAGQKVAFYKLRFARPLNLFFLLSSLLHLWPAITCACVHDRQRASWLVYYK